MRLISDVPASIATSLTALFLSAQVAQAECHYAMDTATNTFEATNVVTDILPNEVLIIGNYDVLEADAIGELMNFECLYRDPISDSTLNTDHKFSPPNIGNLVDVERLLNEYPIQFRFRKQDALMSAVLNCEGITLSFDPQDFLKSDDHDTNSRLFMQSFITSMFGVDFNVALHRQDGYSVWGGDSVSGEYTISEPDGRTNFLQSNDDNCLAPFLGA